MGTGTHRAMPSRLIRVGRTAAWFAGSFLLHGLVFVAGLWLIRNASVDVSATPSPRIFEVQPVTQGHPGAGLRQIPGRGKTGLTSVPAPSRFHGHPVVDRPFRSRSSRPMAHRSLAPRHRAASSRLPPRESREARVRKARGIHRRTSEEQVAGARVAMKTRSLEMPDGAPKRLEATSKDLVAVHEVWNGERRSAALAHVQVASGRRAGPVTGRSAPPAGRSNSAGNGLDRAAVAARIRRAIRRVLVYPVRARRLGLEGAILLSFHIDRLGRARNVRILRSAGSLLDQAAIQALHRAEPLPKFAQEVRIPVRFRLDDS